MVIAGTELMKPTIHWLRSQVALSGHFGGLLGIPKTASKVRLAPLEPSTVRLSLDSETGSLTYQSGPSLEWQLK